MPRAFSRTIRERALISHAHPPAWRLTTREGFWRFANVFGISSGDEMLSGTRLTGKHSLLYDFARLKTDAAEQHAVANSPRSPLTPEQLCQRRGATFARLRMLLTTPEISRTGLVRGRGFCPGSHRPRARVPLVVWAWHCLLCGFLAAVSRPLLSHSINGCFSHRATPFTSPQPAASQARGRSGIQTHAAKALGNC
jgi:hypothetical protein